MKIIGTGLTGLVGSRIVELLKDRHDFENFSSSLGCDVTKRRDVLSFLEASEAPTVVHFAAKTDVDDCEEDKEEDLRILDLPSDKAEQKFIKNKTAWAVNVIGTRNIVDACRKTNKRLIYISTDFVFGGTKEFYTEEDTPNPINWYGKTKQKAEELVSSSGMPYAIIRISYPYRAVFPKKDFVRVLIEFMRYRKPLKMINDYTITPTFIDDLAPILNYFIENDPEGIFHACGGDSLTPFEIASKIADVFSLDKSLISGISGDEFFRDRARRPSQLAIKNDKINRLGLKTKKLEDGLEEIRNQL